MNLNSRMRASSHSAVGEGPRAGEPGWGWGAIPCWPLQGGKNQTFLPPYAGARQVSSASSGNVCVGFQSHSTEVCLDVPFPFVIHQLVCCPSTPSASILAPGSLPRRPDFRNKIHLLSSDNHVGFHGHLEPNVYGLASLSRPTICDWCVSIFPKEAVLCANQHPAGPTFLMFPCAGKAQPIQKAAAQPTCPRPEISLTCFPYYDIAGKYCMFYLFND